VRIRNVTSQDNRRTGLAVPGATDVLVEDSTFLRSRGQDPQAGANCEPGPGSEVHQVRFVRSTFADNAGVGLYVHRGKGVTTDATIEDNDVSGNAQGIIVAGVRGAVVRGNRVRAHRLKGRSGIALGEDTTGAVVADNVLEGNFRGIVSAGATGVQIRGNTVRGTGAAADVASSEDGDGIVCRGIKGVLADACTIADNTVHGVAGSGIVAQLVSRVALSGNRVEDAGQRGIYLAAVTGSEVRENEVVRAGVLGGRRYDSIELAASANDNLVTQNVCRLGPGTRGGILVGPGCLRNRVFGNEEVPWSGPGG
jgi:parallel beta-helix repeat protein